MNGLHSLQREVSGASKGKNKRRASDTDLRSSSGSSATKKRRVVSAEKSSARTSILSYFSPLAKSSSNLSNTNDKAEDSSFQQIVVQKQLNFDSVITIIDSDEESDQNNTPLSRESSGVSIKNNTNEKLSRSTSEVKAADLTPNTNNNNNNNDDISSHTNNEYNITLPRYC